MTSYRYPKSMAWLCLGAVFMFSGMAALIYLTDPVGGRRGIGLVGFGLFTLCAVALPLVACLYFWRYHVLVENKTLQVITIFATTVVDLRLVAQVATFKGKGRDLWLYDHRNKCLLKIAGSIQGFDSLLSEIENRTRSVDVILYKGDQINGWEEKANEDGGDWRRSKGPKPIQDLNRRVAFALATGIALIVFAYCVAHVHFN